MLTSFLAAQYGTISDVEIIWTLVAAIGMIFSLYNVREAYHDLIALRSLKTGNGRTLLAKASIKAEIARLIILAIFLTIGILAATLADPPTQAGLPWNVILIGALIRWGLIAAGLLLTYKSYLAYQLRRTLRDQYSLGVPVEKHTPITDAPEET